MNAPTFARVHKLKVGLNAEDCEVVQALQQLIRDLAYELWDSNFDLDDEFTGGSGEGELRALLREARKAAVPPKGWKP